MNIGQMVKTPDGYGYVLWIRGTRIRVKFPAKAGEAEGPRKTYQKSQVTPERLSPP